MAGAERRSIKVELGFDSEVKSAVASMFKVAKGNPALKALREPLDNVGDARYRDGSQTTEAYIEKGRDVLSDSNALIIVGWRETGVGEQELTKLVRGGGSTSRDDVKKIGLGGLGGGKAAPWFLGKGLRVQGHKAGESEQFVLDDPTYGDSNVAHQGSRDVLVKSVDKNEVPIGKAVTTIYNLKEGVEIPGATNISREFGEVYRPLLVPAEVEVPLFKMDPYRTLNKIPGRQVVTEKGTIQTVYDRMVIWVKGTKKGTERVVPQPIPLKPGYSEDLRVTWTEPEDPKVPRAALGYWFGEINRSDPNGRKVNSGFDVYYDGRLVSRKNWFGLDDRHPALSDLVGEVDASQTDLKKALSVSKALDVSEDHPAWKALERAMHEVLAPIALALIERGRSNDIQSSLVSATELQRIRYFVDAALAEVLSNEELGEAVLGFSTIVSEGGGSPTGQLDPKKLHSSSQGPRQPVGIKGKPWSEQEGRTPRKPGTNLEIPRKRSGLVAKFRFREFAEGDNRRSEIVQEEGVTGTLERVLEVNTRHPDWIHINHIKMLNSNQGDIEITSYIGHELGLRAAEMFTDDAKERKKFVEKVWWALGELINQHPLWALIDR